MGEGTTLVVLDVRGSSFSDKFEYELIRSYALAIEAGNLEVEILGQAIEKGSLEDRWRQILGTLGTSAGQDNEVESIDLENLKTVFSPHQRITMETSLGKCEIRLRSGDDVRSRSVAIARGGGMLISSKPERLKAFSGLENFSCVVWVTDPGGSSELAKLENPAHNEFSKDWLNVSDADTDPESTWARYIEFTATIRDKLKELFALSSGDTYQVKLLDNLLDGVGHDKAEGFGTTRTIRVIERPPRGAKQGEPGSRISGPGVPTKGKVRRKSKGPRVIPTVNGGKVSTGGWKTKEGFATCRIKSAPENKLLLRVDIPTPLESDTGVVFVATSSSGEVLALHDQVELLTAGQSTCTLEIDQPKLNYSIDVFLFERTSGAGVTEQ
jgi:hypothetical protein